MPCLKAVHKELPKTAATQISVFRQRYWRTSFAKTAIALLIFPHEDHFSTLGLLSLAYSLVIGLGANKAAQFTARAIHLKHQNDHLLSHMELEVEKRTQEIYSLSNIDPLTGLYNRKAFSENLSYRLSTQKHRFALLHWHYRLPYLLQRS